MANIAPLHLMRWIEEHKGHWPARLLCEALRTCRKCGAVLPVPAGA